jgi:hypothetical protein
MSTLIIGLGAACSTDSITGPGTLRPENSRVPVVDLSTAQVIVQEPFYTVGATTTARLLMPGALVVDSGSVKWSVDGAVAELVPVGAADPLVAHLNIRSGTPASLTVSFTATLPSGQSGAAGSVSGIPLSGAARFRGTATTIVHAATYAVRSDTARGSSGTPSATATRTTMFGTGRDTTIAWADGFQSLEDAGLRCAGFTWEQHGNGAVRVIPDAASLQLSAAIAGAIPLGTRRGVSIVTVRPGVDTVVIAHADCKGVCGDTIIFTVKPAPTDLRMSVGIPALLRVGQMANPSPVAELIDALESPSALGGIAVRLTALSPGLTLGDTASTTDATGHAPFARFSARGPVGEHRVRVTAAGVPGTLEVLFRLRAGAPAAFRVIDPLPGAPTSGIPFGTGRLQVVDSYGNPVTGEALRLTLRVQSGSESVDPGTLTTDTLGVVDLAGVTLVGTGPGTLIVTESGSGVKFEQPLMARVPSAILVSDSVITVSLGSQATVTATAVDADGKPLSNLGAPQWSSANAGIASVTPGGIVGPVNLGETTLTVRIGGLSATVRVRVVEGSPSATTSTLAFAPNPMAVGSTGTVTVVVKDQFGNVIPTATPADLVGTVRPGILGPFTCVLGTCTANYTAPSTPGAPLLSVTIGGNPIQGSPLSILVRATLLTSVRVASTSGTINTAIAPFTPVTASGGATPYTYALTGGSLPSGMSFNPATGAVSGTPTVALATTTFTVTVTDVTGAISTKTFTLTVNGSGGPALTTSLAVATKTGTLNTAVPAFTPVTASGGTSPYTYALSGGTLPNGMAFSTTTGAVSGTPTVALTTTTFTVTVTDAAAATSSKSFDLTINPALTTTQAVASTTGTVNTAIPAFTPVTVAGGTLPYTYVLTGGTLPTGMSFNTSTGVVSGTPTTTLATTTFTVTVTDAAGASSAKTFTLTVNGPGGPALATTQAVAAKIGTVNAAIASFTPVTASGGTTPYAFALTGGTLPNGMSFDASTGAVSGTPTVALTTTTFTVTVTDAAAATSSKSFDLTINTALTTTQAVAITVGTVNTAIPTFTPVTVAGGTLAYAYALTGGSLPSGMSFDASTGAITGTPTSTLVSTTFTVTVTDAAGATSSKTFSLTVNSALTTTQAVASTSGTVNTLIPSFTPVTASGGTTPYSYALTGGTLPAGMSFSTSTGVVSGTPTATLATTTFTVTVTDVAGASSAKTFTLTVNAPGGPALATTQAVAAKIGTVNAAIASFTPVTASGGTTPYTFALSGGTLPNGMSFNTSTGAVSGTPTTALAVTTFTVTVTDAAAGSSAKTFDLTVNPALTATQSVPSTTGTVNVAIGPFTPVTGGAGTSPYTYALSGGTLPNGMSFDPATGTLSGTPTTTLATTTFTVTVTDAAGATSATTFTLTVNAPGGPALSTSQAISARAGTINTTIPTFTPVTASGGTTPYGYALTGGSLPTGMSFSTATGAVSGTPTTTLATTTFTVTVTDAASATSSKTFTLTVNPALTTTQAVPTTTAALNTALAPFTPVTVSGGTAPYGYALTGSLPAGLSFDVSTGVVSGTPTVTLAATTYTVTVTDAAGATSSKTFSLGVAAALTVSAQTSVALDEVTERIRFVAQGGGINYGVSGATAFALSSGGATGTFYSDAAGTTTISSFSIVSGDSVALVYYKQTSGTGTTTISASRTSGDNVTGVSVALTVTATAPISNRLATLPDGTLRICKNSTGNAANSNSIALSGNNAVGTCAATAGQLLIAVFTASDGPSGSTQNVIPTVTTPAGWTLVQSVSPTTKMVTKVYRIVTDTAGIYIPTFTMNQNGRMSFIVLAVNTPNATTPIDLANSATSSAATPTAGTIALPSVPVQVDNSALLFIGTQDIGTTFTAPTGLTTVDQIGNGGSFMSIVILAKDRAFKGPSPAYSLGTGSTGNPYVSFVYLLPPQ